MGFHRAALRWRRPHVLASLCEDIHACSRRSWSHRLFRSGVIISPSCNSGRAGYGRTGLACMILTGRPINFARQMCMCVVQFRAIDNISAARGAKF